jgi:hypothetical protein
MGLADRYQAYADAFEESYVDDDWSRLEEFFTEDVQYDAGQSPDPVATSRNDLLAWFKSAVDEFDRRLDSREVIFTDGPREIESGIVAVKWKAIFTKAGAPDLVMSGVETAEFEGDRIKLLKDTYDDGIPELIDEWVGEHGL